MTSRRGRVVVFGSVNADITVHAPRLPKPGETVLGTSRSADAGGKGANQAVAAARMGAAVTLVACIGTDPDGDEVLARVAAEGVDVRHVRRHPTLPTGTAVITVADAGANTIVAVALANADLSPSDVEAVAFDEVAVVLVQLECPLESIVAGLRAGRAAGALTILNPAPARPLTADTLGLADVCILNQTEVPVLTGETDALGAARGLRAAGCGAVVVTLGADGAIVADERGATRLPPASVERVLDPTAAGDAFCGTVAALMAEGRALPDALRYASIAGALAVTRHGAMSSLPTRAEVEVRLSRG